MCVYYVSVYWLHVTINFFSPFSHARHSTIFFLCVHGFSHGKTFTFGRHCVRKWSLSLYFFAMILGARSHAIFHWQTGCCIHCFFCRLSLGLSVWPLALAPYPMHVQSDRFLIGRHIKSSGIFCSIFSFARVNVLGISTNPFILIGTKQRKNIHGMLQSHELTLTHVFTVIKCHFRQHRGSLICCDLLSEQEKKKNLLNELGRSIGECDLDLNFPCGLWRHWNWQSPLNGLIESIARINKLPFAQKWILRTHYFFLSFVATDESDICAFSAFFLLSFCFVRTRCERAMAIDIPEIVLFRFGFLSNGLSFGVLETGQANCTQHTYNRL